MGNGGGGGGVPGLIVGPFVFVLLFEPPQAAASSTPATINNAQVRFNQTIDRLHAGPLPDAQAMYQPPSTLIACPVM